MAFPLYPMLRGGGGEENKTDEIVLMCVFGNNDTEITNNKHEKFKLGERERQR